MVKLKSFERSALFTWSPSRLHPTYLACGTTAQQFDASFSTNAILELCSLDIGSDVNDMHVIGSSNVQHRFHKLVWSPFSSGSSDNSYGTLIGGSDGGIISFFNASKIKTQQSALVHQTQKHSGSVRALDYNSFKPQLLASGGGESELFIWDLSNPTTPMTPGPKAQPLEHVVSVKWNCKVEHILASVYPSRAMIWDLRRTDGPIIKIGELGHRVQWKDVCWHPNSATSLCLACEDDHFPCVQQWDLRYAQSPVLQLDGHQKGVLSIDWCLSDPNLLVSSAKDSRIYVWNPNTGEFLTEIPYMGHHWPFDVKWCPRIPNLIGCSSYDGQVSVYAVVANGPPTQLITASPKLAESFPGADFSHPPAPKMATQQQPKPVLLPHPPKWMNSPIGARFAFGGKLITFDNPAQTPEETANSLQPVVFINQVTTNSSMADEAQKFYDVVQNGQYAVHCENRVAATHDEFDKTVWSLLEAHFEAEPRMKSLSILGFDDDEMQAKAQRLLGSTRVLEDSANLNRGSVSPDNLAASMAQLTSSDSSVDEVNFDDALKRTGIKLPLTESVESVICQAILLDHLETAVDLCIEQGDWTNAVLLAVADGKTVFNKTIRKYLENSRSVTAKLASILMYRRWDSFVTNVALENWPEAMCAVLCHGAGSDLHRLADILGQRLEHEGDGRLKRYAALCYVCAGLTDRFVASIASVKRPSVAATAFLHDVVEKALVLRGALGAGSQRVVSVGPEVAHHLSQFATLLAQQGCLSVALQYLLMLPEETDPHLMDLRERLYMACGGSQSFPSVKRPKASFTHVESTQDRRFSQAAMLRSRGPSISNQLTPTAAAAPGRGFSYPSAHSATSLSASAYSQAANVPPVVAYAPPVPPPIATNFYNPPSATAHVASTMHAGPTQYQHQQQSASMPPPPSGDQVSSSSHSLSNLSRARYPSYQQDHALGYNQQPMYQSMNVPAAVPVATNYGSYSQHPQSRMVDSDVNLMSNTVPAQQRNPPVATVAPQSQRTTPWNDPPPLGPKKQPAPSRSETPAPITQPVLGGMSTAEFPPVGAMSPYGMQAHTVGAGLPSSPAPQVAPRPLGPIPQEHLLIQQVLDRLLRMCLAHTNNVQTQRKLEDVGRKLDEGLYNQLKAQQLSHDVLANLHHMMGYIQARDYQSSLAIQASLAQGANFATMAHFLPALKVLLQTALQLGVYF